MSFAKQHGVVKNIKTFFASLFRSQQENPAPEEQNQYRQKTQAAGKNEPSSLEASSPKKTSYSSRSAPSLGADLEDMDQWFPSSREKDQEPKGEPEPPQEQEVIPDDDLMAGGIYSLQEQEDGPYWLTKVIYVEEQVVHVVCYAQRPEQLPSEIVEQQLTIALNKEDSSFGIEHLPLPRTDFAANAVLLGQRSLSENDFTGYRLYVDSVFDCLDEQAPDWLKKAGSYAAWRYDHNAMAALADRYLIGVDLPRDSSKSLYWLNRLVHAGKDLVQPETAIESEKQILTGGVYACPQEDDRYRICKVVLKDKHGLQLINFPAHLGQLPESLHLAQSVEQAAARRTGKPPVLSHVALEASGFLEQSPIFLGLLPVTVHELHCYRSHLRKMFEGAEFQKSAWESLQKRAADGDLQAQLDVAYRYIDGDSAWEVKRNIPEAIPWLTEAANQGHALAAYNLAMLFQQGEEGVAPDPQLGLEWLAYAAQLNYGPAQLHTADCYRQGKGCTENIAIAHAWYTLALQTENGLPEEARQRAKQGRREIERSCTPEQLTEAQDYLQQLQAPS
ncbi:MAG: tetratricopeptide repeat protein [Candidatus Electrothrix scaldis]|nr:MAG: tetratricopeptide repeat protein [Candidatus Electrothrix sp. GW3-3]